MRRMLSVTVVTLGCVGLTGMAAAQDAAQLADLRGRWVGTSDAVVLGNPLHHAHDNDAQKKPRLSNMEFTITIEGQEGRRFWGTVSTHRHTEPLIGVIGFDGKTIILQESDGTSHATLVDKDTIEYVYSHATQDTLVVSANRVKRQK